MACEENAAEDEPTKFEKAETEWDSSQKATKETKAEFFGQRNDCQGNRVGAGTVRTSVTPLVQNIGGWTARRQKIGEAWHRFQNEDA